MLKQLALGLALVVAGAAHAKNDAIDCGSCKEFGRQPGNGGRAKPGDTSVYAAVAGKRLAARLAKERAVRSPAFDA